MRSGRVKRREAIFALSILSQSEDLLLLDVWNQEGIHDAAASADFVCVSEEPSPSCSVARPTGLLLPWPGSSSFTTSFAASSSRPSFSCSRRRSAQHVRFRSSETRERRRTDEVFEVLIAPHQLTMLEREVLLLCHGRACQHNSVRDALSRTYACTAARPHRPSDSSHTLRCSPRAPPDVP